MVVSCTKFPDKASSDGDPDRNVGVLPTDHPMLARFQRALKEHLTKVTRQLEEEIEEINHNITEKDVEIAEVGSKLFDLQNDIEKQREQLDKFNGQILDLAEKRKVHEDSAAKLKKEFEQRDLSYKESKRIHNETLQEIDNLHILENEIAKWNEEVQNEVALSKRIASKDSKDQRAISEQKKKMDLILFKLDEEVRKGQRELTNINDQIAENREAVDCLNKSLSDANIDLEGLQQEHKKLMQAWGEVIVAIQLRDKVLSKAKTNLL